MKDLRTRLDRLTQQLAQIRSIPATIVLAPIEEKARRERAETTFKREETKSNVCARTVTVENVSVDYESPEDDVDKPFRWTEAKPYGGEQNNYLLASLKYGGDNIKDNVVDLTPVEKAPLCLLVMDADDHYDNYIKARPPDECAPDNVYRGGSPLSIVGVVTCNVPNGLGIKIFYWWISFRMRFGGLDCMEYPSFLFV